MLLFHLVDAPTIYFALVYILKANLMFMLVAHVGKFVHGLDDTCGVSTHQHAFETAQVGEN